MSESANGPHLAGPDTADFPRRGFRAPLTETSGLAHQHRHLEIGRIRYVGTCAPAPHTAASPRCHHHVATLGCQLPPQPTLPRSLQLVRSIRPVQRQLPHCRRPGGCLAALLVDRVQHPEMDWERRARLRDAHIHRREAQGARPRPTKTKLEIPCGGSKRALGGCCSAFP